MVLIKFPLLRYLILNVFYFSNVAALDSVFFFKEKSQRLDGVFDLI